MVLDSNYFDYSNCFDFSNARFIVQIIIHTLQLQQKSLLPFSQNKFCKNNIQIFKIPNRLSHPFLGRESLGKIMPLFVAIGLDGIRTRGLSRARGALYQLSYKPKTRGFELAQFTRTQLQP